MAGTCFWGQRRAVFLRGCKGKCQSIYTNGDEHVVIVGFNACYGAIDSLVDEIHFDDQRRGVNRQGNWRRQVKKKKSN